MSPTTTSSADVRPVHSRALAALAAVLPRSVALEPLESDGRSLIVRVGRRRVGLLWVGRGGVRDIQQVLDLKERPDVIVASELSLAARAAASEGGLGWVDESGAAEIVIDDIVVSRDGRVTRVREPAAGWTPSVISVAEAILTGTAATVTATAQATGHSLSSTAQALTALTEMGLLEAKAARGPNSGRRVVDADRLLEQYAQAAADRRSGVELRCGVLWRDPLATMEKIGRSWNQAERAWAVTGALAGAVLAPLLTDITAGDVYVEAERLPELLEFARIADIEPMDGGRLVLRPFPTAASRRLTTHTDGLRVVPWPRAYADLRTIGVRGEEAAEHLRELRDGR
jgi:hypothetical protein